MNERIHLPPQHDMIPETVPLVFLGGPAEGAPDWQTPTAISLTDNIDTVHVASPRRRTVNGFNYDQHIRWEKDHLRRSSELGVIMFWFAAQRPDILGSAAQSYAQRNRIEIGRVLGWHDYNPFPLVIGIDPHYTMSGGGNEHYFRSLAAEANIPVYDDLEETIDQTILRI